MNLKEALLKGKLKDFIKERAAQKSDGKRFDKVISSMVGKKKAVPKASARKKRES